MQSNILAFKSILHREFKDFSATEDFILQAQALVTQATWLRSVHCRLLLDQYQDDASLTMAQTNYLRTPSVMNLRTHLSAIQKMQGLKPAIRR